MAEIETLAEGQAFMDAADDILGLNHPLRDVEIARLRQAWIAGRDWVTDQEMLAQIEEHGARVRAEMERQVKLGLCPHVDGCTTAEQCKGRRQQP